MKEVQTNQSVTESNVAQSRRDFLKRLAYGSLLAIGGPSIAQATMRHASHSNKSHAQHANTHSAKHTAKSHAHSHDKHHIAQSHHSHSTHHAHNAHGGHNKHHIASRKHHHDTVYARSSEGVRHEMTYNNFDSDLGSDSFFAEKRPNSFDEFNYQTSRIYTPTRTEKTIALQNMNTGDKVNLTYFEKGRYIKDALAEINYIFRDHFNDSIHPIDPALLDQLFDLKELLNINSPIHLISGYRSPETNARLRERSGRVARNSFHMQGRAIDIRIEGTSARNIRDAALSMAQGGVGYYPYANFVHLDTGDVRTW